MLRTRYHRAPDEDNGRRRRGLLTLPEVCVMCRVRLASGRWERTAESSSSRSRSDRFLSWPSNRVCSEFDAEAAPWTMVVLLATVRRCDPRKDTCSLSGGNLFFVVMRVVADGDPLPISKLELMESYVFFSFGNKNKRGMKDVLSLTLLWFWNHRKCFVIDKCIILSFYK